MQFHVRRMTQSFEGKKLFQREKVSQSNLVQYFSLSKVKTDLLLLFTL